MDSQTGEANDRRKNLGHTCRFLGAIQQAYAGYVALPRRSKDGQGMMLTRTDSSFGLYVKHNITDPLVHTNHPFVRLSLSNAFTGQTRRRACWRIWRVHMR